MENQLFTWKSWNNLEEMAFSFYDIVLTRDIGQYKKGDKFSVADLDYANGTLTLWNETGTEKLTVFNLRLEI